MKTLKLFSVIFTIILMAGCTENSRVKSWGGSGTLDLPAGQKLINITWKEGQIWYLTRPAKPGETPETYQFQEESSFGIVEGTYTIKEH